MQRRWSFPPSRILDAMLVIFAINGVLVATSIVARYATADDSPSQSALVDETTADDEKVPTSNAAVAVATPDGGATSEARQEAVSQPTDSAATPLLSTNQAIDQLPGEIPPPPEIPVPDEALLESLKQDSQFQEFVEIAAEQYPEYLTTSRPGEIAESGTVVGSDKLRDMEERLLVVADLNQAALRLARIAHRHAAAERATHSQQALQLSQQLQEMSAQLLRLP